MEMIQTFRRLFKCVTGTAAVEAAIFLPIFLFLTLGITDVGGGMFVRMTVNAAAQAGAAYAVINSCASAAACQTGVNTAMDDATGNPSFCTGSAQNPTPCTVSITTCADGSPRCIIVTAKFLFSPILPDVLYASVWAQQMTVSSTATVRVQ